MTVQVVTQVMKAGAALCVGVGFVIIAIKADNETANRVLAQCGDALGRFGDCDSNR